MAAGYLHYERVEHCPVCAAPGRFSIDPPAAIVQCNVCGHRYVDPRPTQEDIARAYSLPTAYEDWLRSADARAALWRRRFDQVLGNVPVGRLLDIGAGIGTFLAIARDRGWTVEGTEVSTTAIAHARAAYDLAIHEGFIEDAALHGPFDVITLWHVLEHLPDPAGTLRFCRGILAERGMLILAMPNDGAAVWALTVIGNLGRRALGKARSPRYEPLRPGGESHIQHFTERSIRRLLADSGLPVERVTMDDAAPSRSRVGSALFMMRRLLSAATPWCFAREMLVTASRP